jgi:XrtJ-associated TM-motif-TM protein
MNKSVLYMLCATCLLLAAAPLHAEGGCVDSPENPTVVLALVGAAGGLFSAVRARAKGRNRSR